MSHYVIHHDTIICRFAGTRKELVPEQVQKMTRSEYGVSCSYWKARRARATAIEVKHGTYEDSYRDIIPYLHMLEQTNAGTYTKLELDASQRFKYAFISFGAWRKAIPYLRKVIPHVGTQILHVT